MCWRHVNTSSGEVEPRNISRGAEGGGRREGIIAVTLVY